MHVIDQAGLDIGDIILFSESREYRASSDSIAARRYYHAAIWVGGTLIHATANGVYSTNLQRVHFSNADDAVVLRPKTPLFPSEAKVIANYARSLTGSLYAFSEVELARSGRRQKIGEAATKRQFCSRLVALAYAQAGISITRSANPMYCTPRMISLSSILTPVQGMLRLANALEIEMAATPDPIRINQEQCYFWLNGIRKIVAESPNLYSAWDIQTENDAWELVFAHHELDAPATRLLRESGYLYFYDHDASVERNKYRYNREAMRSKLKESNAKSLLLSEFSKEPEMLARFTVMLESALNRYAATRLDFFREYTVLYMNLLKTVATRIEVIRYGFNRIHRHTSAQEANRLLQQARKKINLAESTLSSIAAQHA